MLCKTRGRPPGSASSGSLRARLAGPAPVGDAAAGPAGERAARAYPAGHSSKADPASAGLRCCGPASVSLMAAPPFRIARTGATRWRERPGTRTGTGWRRGARRRVGSWPPGAERCEGRAGKSRRRACCALSGSNGAAGMRYGRPRTGRGGSGSGNRAPGCMPGAWSGSGGMGSRRRRRRASRCVRSRPRRGRAACATASAGRQRAAILALRQPPRGAAAARRSSGSRSVRGTAHASTGAWRWPPGIRRGLRSNARRSLTGGHWKPKGARLHGERFQPSGIRP